MVLNFCVDKLVNSIEVSDAQREVINKVFFKYYHQNGISDFNDIYEDLAKELYGDNKDDWNLEDLNYIFSDIFVQSKDIRINGVDHVHESEDRSGSVLIAEDTDGGKVYFDVSYTYSEDVSIYRCMCDFYPKFKASVRYEIKIPVIQKFQRFDFKYPDSKSGLIKDRELIVLDYDDKSISGISLTDNPRKDELLRAIENLDKLIKENMAFYRKFNCDKMC
jgi:hypothetical protein